MSTKYILRILLLVLSFEVFSSTTQPPVPQAGFVFPYKEAGLSSRQAAAHLLNRFTYGPGPGDIDAVLNKGLENWFAEQLKGDLPDTDLKNRLTEYDVLHMSIPQIVKTFPKPLQVFRQAKADGVITDDSLQLKDEKKYKQLLRDYTEKKGYRSQSELYRQFFNAKVLRSAYSNNQLHEVLTEFWFNHFNVSMTKRPCALFIPNYERDAIRPFVSGSFEKMLLATAKSPAMLIYLDNFSSSGNNEEFDDGRRLARKLKDLNDRLDQGDTVARQTLKKIQNLQKNKGLNENYAREVMELHTLGVDGGYTQQDVTEAARVLTGWTLYPMEDGVGAGFRGIINKIGEDKLAERGFVHEGDFFFALNRHDDKPKTVMNKRFPGNGGYQEGLELLHMLAHHPSTAKFISRKLAVRFVSDEPPASLINKMAKSFLEKDGDISEVLKTMVCAPEFWSPAALRSKTKSPFELTISAIRSLKADLNAPIQVFRITDRMGQKMYSYPAPTGFPDRATYWINSGALLNRMNFGMMLAAQQIRGISSDLLALNQNHEPESPTDALAIYSRILLPERNLEQTIRRLTPLLTDPAYAGRLQQEAGKNKIQDKMNDDDEIAQLYRDEEGNTQKNDKQTQRMLAQVVGIILGSPEFQRR